MKSTLSIVVVMLIFSLGISSSANAVSKNHRLFRAHGAGNSSGPSSPPGVPQAVFDQGFTTLAFDGDIVANGFDVSCANPATGTHTWYIGANKLMYGNCANLRYPHTDETDGSTVLDIHIGPSTQDGGQQGRVGISTSDQFGAHATHYPINGYYECTVRMDAYSISHMPLWHNCWSGDWFGINVASPGDQTVEYDITEFHGGYDNTQEIAGDINWGCGGPSNTCYNTSWFGNPANVISGYDPSQWHTYGMLQYQTSVKNMHVIGYIDDVQITEGDIEMASTGGGPVRVQDQQERLYPVIDLTAACRFDEGEGSFDICTNKTIINVFADTSGNTVVQTQAHSGYETFGDGFYMDIHGVIGVTSPINGRFGQHGLNWAWWDTARGRPCEDADGNIEGCKYQLLDAPFGNPIHFTGTYASGGIVNEWNDTDRELHVYVKSFRVYSCANWATTQCSTFNPF